MKNLKKILLEIQDLEQAKFAITSDWNQKRRKLYAKYKNPLKALNSQIESKKIEIEKILNK